MNPVVAQALGSIIRGLLWAAAGYLVKHHLWSDANATVYVEAATLAVVGFVWSVYQAWKNDQLVKYLSERLHWHQWSAVRSAPASGSVTVTGVPIQPGSTAHPSRVPVPPFDVD